jgi:tRNA pseudouridine55 synthase
MNSESGTPIPAMSFINFQYLPFKNLTFLSGSIGSDLKLKAKSITIHEYEITRIELPEVDFRIKCSKGTYIRSLAHDLGAALNNGGYLKALRRTAIGNYNVTDAKSVEDWVTEIKDAEVAPFES